MKKLLLLSAIALVATGAGATDIKPYIEGKISENWMKVTADSSDKKLNGVQGASIEVGAKIDQFRVGLEGYYNDRAEGSENLLMWTAILKFRTKGAFLNGYWDIPMCENWKKIKPYVGAGVGYSWLRESAEIMGAKLESYKDKDWSWNVGLGVAYELNNNVDLTLGYRYEDLGKIKKDDIKNKFTNHKVSLGLRYTF